jgi:hypothetical protein
MSYIEQLQSLSRRAPDANYARITRQGLEEIGRELAEAGPCLADTTPPAQPAADLGGVWGWSPTPGRGRARLADTPPSAQRTAEQSVQEARQQQARAHPRLANTPTPALTPAQKAENLQNLSGAVFLFGAAGKVYGSGIDVPAFKAYLDTFLKDAGSPTDPVERMLLEQLALAHHAIGRLHFRAGTSESLDAVTTCHAAAARLQAEFRRTSLALQAYRETAASKRAGAEGCRPPRAKGEARHKNGSAANGVKIRPDTEIGSNHNRVSEYLHECEPALS